MGKNIIITESQYSRIFLNEQDPPSFRGGNFQPLKNINLPKIDITQDLKSWKSNPPIGKISPVEPEIYPMSHLQSDNVGPNSPLAVELKRRAELAMDRTYIPKRHDSMCNAKWRKYCSAKGEVATNVTRKGKDWDILSGKATKLNNGEYSTLGWGEWDNENVTKCRCGEGKVLIRQNGDTEFVGVGAQFKKLNIIPGSMHDKYLRGQISDKQYHNHQMYKLRVYNNKISKLNDKVGIDKFIETYKHEIIDVLAVAALFIPVPGLNVALSIGLEGLNAAMYLAEGDNTSGFLSVIFMALPGIGPLARRITQKGVKKVYNIFEVARNMKNSGKSADEIAEYMAEQSKKLTPDEQKFLKEINKPENIKKIEQSGKELESLTQSGRHFKPKDVLDNAFGKNSKEYNHFLNYQTGFGKNSKFLKELMNPTKMEKYIFAGAVLGMMTLDKSGLMSIATDKFLKLLVDLGLKNPGINEKDIEKTKTKVEKEINQGVFDYINSKGSTPLKDRTTLTLPSDVKEKIYKKANNTIKTSIEVMNTIPNKNLIPKVLDLPTDKQQKIVNKLKNEGIKYNTKLRNFRNYKWANFCKNQNSKFNISVPNIKIDDEKVDWLDDRALNYRYIKSPKLGSQFEYASDEDGLWFYKKTGSDQWKLVVNCGALLKIETELEKLNDKDLDTEGELVDFMKLYGIEND